jgi:prophage antirepressor-like protein
MIDGEPWFVLRDLLKAMETKSRTNDILPVIKDTFGADTILSYQLDTGFGIKPTTLINEAAMTFVVSQGRTETSKALNRKIHQEILPSIRKTGRFEIEPKTEAQKILEVMTLLQNKVQEEEAAKNKALAKVRNSITPSILQNRKLKEQQPKVEVYDTFLQKDNLSMSLTNAALAQKIPHPRMMINVLKSGIVNGQFNHHYKWLKAGAAKPITATVNNGFMESKQEVNDGISYTAHYVTPKGQAMLRKMFNPNNLPQEMLCSKKSCCGRRKAESDPTTFGIEE